MVKVLLNGMKMSSLFFFFADLVRLSVMNKIGTDLKAHKSGGEI